MKKGQIISLIQVKIFFLFEIEVIGIELIAKLGKIVALNCMLNFH